MMKLNLAPPVPNPLAQAVTAAMEVAAEDTSDGPLAAPEVTASMYHGLAGEVMRAACDGTEVHPAAVGLAFLCFMGVALGRTRYIRVGDDIHHPRLYSCHVGRSSLAGKGMALGLPKRIRAAVEHGGNPLRPTCGWFHDGGLSSREGLAFRIRDPSDEQDDDGNPTDPGVKDKRLLVVEEEFANVLHQAERDGNTLSAAVRTLWDGSDLAPLTKTSRVRVTTPHVGIHACITPSELTACLSAREMSNGFANRFLFVYAERQGEVPFPAPTSKNLVDQFAQRVRDAVAFTDQEGAMAATDGAKALFADFYREHRRAVDLPPMVRGLLERHPPYAWRLALIFALLDRVDEIAEPHMKAALAWLAFCRQSVIRIFSTAKAQDDADEAGALAKHVIAVIQGAGGIIDHMALRAALGKPRKALLDAALEQLDMAGLVECVSRSRSDGSAGRRAREYRVKRANAGSNDGPHASNSKAGPIGLTDPSVQTAKAGLADKTELEVFHL